MNSFFSLPFFKGNSPPKLLFVSLLLTMVCCTPVHAVNPPTETLYPASEITWTCSTTGGAKSGDDCVSTNKHSIGFNFSFYGSSTPLTDFYLYTNGFIRIGDSSLASLAELIGTPATSMGNYFSRNHLFAYTQSTCDTNSPKNCSYNSSPLQPPLSSTIPALGQNPNGIVAPFWDDVAFDWTASPNPVPTKPNTVYYKTQNTLSGYSSTIGDSSKKQLIVQWTNPTLFAGPPLGTFQAILYENTGGANPKCDIRLQYRQFIGTKYSVFGGDATIGVEDALGNNPYLKYSYGSGKYPKNSSTHIFSAPPAPTNTPLKGIDLANNKSICLKWNGTQYNITTEDIYDPVYLAPNPPPPAIPKITAPKVITAPTINCPMNGATYSWQPGSYAPPTISNVVSYNLKVVRKSAETEDIFWQSKPLPTPTPIIIDRTFDGTKTSHIAESPSEDLSAGTYYIAVIAKNNSGETWSEVKECVAINNEPPKIAKTLPSTPLAPLDDVAVTVGDTISPMPSFEVSDDITAIGSLVLEPSASDAVLIPTLSASPTASTNPQQLTITPKANASGKSLITIMVTDGHSLSATASFNLLIKPKLELKQGATAITSPLTVAANTTLNIDSVGTGSNLEYSITDKPASVTTATINATTGAFSWTPTNSNVTTTTPHTFKITVTDKMTGATNELPQTFQVNVTATSNFNLTVNTVGSGRVTSSSGGIDCYKNTGTCTLLGSSTVTLTPDPDSGWQLSNWSGDCNSSGAVTLTKDSTCTATFSLTPIIITPPPVVYYGLTIKHAGTGKGTVTGTDGIDCSNTSGTSTEVCYRSFSENRSVSLATAADSNSEFAGWSTGCSDPFNISANMTCTATFNLKTFAVTITQPTGGKVSAPGLDCGTDCSENISLNGTITLTAEPDPGFVFAGWSGDCAGSNPLTLTVDKAKNCQAIFVPLFKLTVSAPNGSIIKTTENTTIDCGTTCSKDYAQDTLVKLQATPQAGYEFTQWTGDCSGTTNPLEIKMDAAKTCQAAFTQTRRMLTLNIDNGTVEVIHSTPGLMPDGGGIVFSATHNEWLYPEGEGLTLTAAASSGYIFTGWEGDCSGTTATVVLTLNVDKTCHAKMISTAVPILVIAEPTKGKVTGLNLDCGATCSATYPQPTSVELTVIPESGYTFTGWTGDCSGTANPLTINVDSAKNCTANFAPIPLTLTLTPPTHGKISASGLDCGTTCSQPLPPGTKIPLTATPEAGYIFTGWSGDCAGTENPLTVTVDKAKNCQANFAPITLPILVVTNPTQGTVAGSGIECGTICTAAYPGKTAATLTATPSPGYTFKGWTGDCSGTANPITLEVDSGKKCTANFEPILVPLNVSKPTNGKVSIPGLDCSNGCSANLPQNSSVTISATPDPGFVFAGWSGDCAGTTNPLTLTLDAAKNCTPIFAPADKPMIIIANPTQGKVTGDEIDCGTKCTKTFPATTTITLTATPEPGFVFTGWSGDCSGTANPLTIEISKAKSCKANFAPVMLPVTISKPANGKVSAPNLTCDTTTCNGSYPQNSTVTLTAIPDTGFVFVGWSGDCSGMANPLTIQIDKAKNCQANFIPVTQPALIIPELIKGTVSGEGINLCSTACAQPLPQKQTVTLTATPEPGYIFTGWSGDCSGMTNPITVEIDKVTTCIPTFTPAPLVVKISQPLHGKVAGLGLNCGDDCTENYPYGSNLTLTATPEDGYVFVGWSGSCSGTANPITVQAELAAQCIPLFAKPTPTTASPFYSLMVGNTDTSQGMVVSQPQGIDCGQDCYQQFLEITTVQLTATPSSGFQFRSWSGDCQGNANPFTLTVDATKSCQAQFEPVATPPMQPSVLDITLKVGETQQHKITGGQNPRTVTQLPDSTLIDMLWDSPVDLLTVTGKVVGKTQMIITDALQRTAIVNITVVPGCRYNMIGLTHKGETVDGGFNCITPQIADLTPKCRVNAVGIDREGKQIFSHSCFTNHVKTRAARPFVPDAYPMTQVLDFSATITVDPRFIGQKAEVLMVAYSAIYGRVDAFMRDGDTWVDWDNKPQNLKAAQLIDKLPSQFDVSIHNGNLSDLLGDAEVYVGYRLENGDIYYNGVEPIRFQIGNSASVDPALNTEKNVHSNEVNAGSYFEPVTGTQDGLQKNHQIFTNREALSLVTYLLVDKKHVGQVADILMVAVHQPYANPAASYQRIGERWELWDEKISSLQPAQHYDQLPDNLEIPIYMGSLAEVPGEFTVYVGYRLSDNTIIFNGLSPHHFAVANALGRDKDGNPTKPTARFVNSVNYLNMIHSSGRVTAQDDIGVYSSIWVDPNHIGQKADILMAMLRSEGDNYQSYQRNLEQWELWDEQQVSLKATIPNVTLEPLMKDLQLFAGRLEPDDYLMYIGYRLPNGEVIYNGGEVIHVKVSE